MSEATVKALTDRIYDALIDSHKLEELDNEQVYEAARVAAQTIEAAGIPKAIIRAWLAEHGLTAAQVWSYVHVAFREEADRWAKAIREVSS